MKRLSIIILFLCLSLPTLGQELYIIYDPNTPAVLKDIKKYKRLKASHAPVMYPCQMVKSNNYHIYVVGYPIYCGANLYLDAKRGQITQTIPLSDVATLYAYPKGRTPAQLDADMQPAIDLDYQYGWVDSPENSRTVKYFDQFTKIYVIELDHANRQAHIVEVFISNVFR
jgi:hypothetical protein